MAEEITAGDGDFGTNEAVDDSFFLRTDLEERKEACSSLVEQVKKFIAENDLHIDLRPIVDMYFCAQNVGSDGFSLFNEILSADFLEIYDFLEDKIDIDY